MQRSSCSRLRASTSPNVLIVLIAPSSLCRSSSTDGGIRTPTGRFLRPVPLPVGLHPHDEPPAVVLGGRLVASSRCRARRPRCRAPPPQACLAARLERDHLRRTRLRRMPSRDQREMPVQVPSSLFGA